jgi:hypothetical protein
MITNFINIQNIILLLVNFTTYFTECQAQIAYNVPAVCDVFAVAINEHEAFQQPQKCGGEKPHKGR